MLMEKLKEELPMMSKSCWTRMKMQAIMKKRKTRRVVMVPLME
jgi:hypothetical protein